MVRGNLADERACTDTGSALTYHITAAAWRRPLSHNASYIHPRREVYAGEDNKVCCCMVFREQNTKENSFMAHPEGLLPLPDIEDPVERFLGVVKFYLSGWHIKPP